MNQYCRGLKDNQFYGPSRFFKTYNSMKAPQICLESMLVIVGNYSIRVRLCRHCGSSYTPFVRPTTRPSRALGSRDMGRNVQHQVEKNMENTMDTFRSSRDKWIHESYRVAKIELISTTLSPWKMPIQAYPKNQFL